MSLAQNRGAVAAKIDFDLHGLLGLRLLNPSAKDVAAVSRQLGLTEKSLSREPDIIIRFVERIPTSSVNYLGLDDVGFTEDAFLFLRGKNGKHTRIQMPCEQVGDRCEIVCESGISSVPFLMTIVNMAVLRKSILPLHASAFKYNGVGVLITGWAKGGKTETLLGFMAQGAEYIGDEWVYISSDAQSMFGIPISMRIWDWHLSSMPEYRARIKGRELARMRSVKVAHSVVQTTSQSINGAIHKNRSLERMASVLRRQLYVDIFPKQLFNGGVGSMSGRFDQLFLVISRDEPDVKVLPLDADEVARRMVFSLQFEYSEYMSNYLKFRFAFPELRNDFMERLEQIQRDLLTRAFFGKQAFVVYHPYPVPIPAVVEAITPLIHL